MKYDILTTEEFDSWYLSLRDRVAAKAIAKRLTRVAAGNIGDISSVGNGISEMRIFVGKGYRLYFTFRNQNLVILLCGGDKSTQSKDIEKAKTLLKKLEYQT